MQIKKKGQEGFTLIELLVVVVIIGILSSVAVPNFMGAQDKAKNSGVQANVHNVQMSLEQFGVDNAGGFPADLGGVITGGYMTGYPKTPWGKTQNTHFATPSVATSNVVNGLIGAGSGAAVTAVTNYGAVSYSRTGTADERYEMVGSGKKGNNAITTIYVKNY